MEVVSKMRRMRKMRRRRHGESNGSGTTRHPVVHGSSTYNKVSPRTYNTVSGRKFPVSFYSLSLARRENRGPRLVDGEINTGPNGIARSGMCWAYEVYEVVESTVLGLRRDNKHVSPGDISYVTGRCPVFDGSLVALPRNY